MVAFSSYNKRNNKILRFVHEAMINWETFEYCAVFSPATCCLSASWIQPRVSWPALLFSPFSVTSLWTREKKSVRSSAKVGWMLFDLCTMSCPHRTRARVYRLPRGLHLPQFPWQQHPRVPLLLHVAVFGDRQSGLPKPLSSLRPSSLFISLPRWRSSSRPSMTISVSVYVVSWSARSWLCSWCALLLTCSACQISPMLVDLLFNLIIF